MPIQYVGGNTGTWVGSTGTTNTVSLTALTGGIATSAAIGDLVIAVYSTGSTVDRTLSITTGYTLIATELYSNGTSTDTNLRVAYKVLTAADTTVSFGPTGNNADAGAAAVYVFRGVSGVIFDVTTTTATGTGTGRPTPPAITPVDPGTVIVAIGAAAAATGAVFTSATLTAFRSVTSADTYDAMLGIGHFFWTSGTYTPAQFGGGTTGTGDSWAAMTIALQATQTFNETITESVTATDAQLQGSVLNDSISESVTATDSSDATPQRNADITETVTASDSSTADNTARANVWEGAVVAQSFITSNAPSAISTTSSFGIDFTALYTTEITLFRAVAYRNTTYATDFNLELWQGTTLIATTPVDGNALNLGSSGSGLIEYYINGLGFNVTAGLPYSIRLNPNGQSVARRYYNTATVSGNPSNLFGQARAAGITNYPSSSTQANLISVYSTIATDTQLSGSGFTADITESVTATDTQDSLFAITADITESVTATDAQDAANTSSASITESVTATDTPTATNTARVLQWEGSVIAFVGGVSSSSNASNTSSSFGIGFTAPYTTEITTLRVMAYRSVTYASDFNIELWQGTTLVATTPVSGNDLATSATPSQRTIYYLYGLGFNVTAGLAYTIRLNPNGQSVSRRYFQETPSSFNVNNILGQDTNAGLTNYPLNSSQLSLFDVFGTIATDSEAAGFVATASITESVTATDTQDGGLNIVSSITESVTATDAQVVDAATIDASITESVTASDSETAVIQANVWLLENTVNGPFAQGIIGTIASTNSLSTGLRSAGIRFIANQTSQIGKVTFEGRRSGSGGAPVQPGYVTVWQLASNSLSALPSVKLGEVSFDFSATFSITVVPVEFDLSSLNITLTQGVGYAVTITNPSDGNTSTQYLTLSLVNGTSDTAAYNYYTALYSDINGTYPSSYSSTSFAYNVNVEPVQLTTDSQAAGFVAAASITESVTATDTQDALFTYLVSITESVTATDAQDAIVTIDEANAETVTATDSQVAIFTTSVSITETVTATDSETASIVFTADITESVTATDTEDAVLVTNVSISESVTATETQNTLPSTFTATITESVTATESAIGVGGEVYEGGAFAFGPIASATIADANTNYNAINTQGAVVYLTGVFGTGQTGTATVRTDVLVSLTGVQATGYVGQTAVAARGIYEGGAFAFGSFASAAIADANTDYTDIQTQSVEVYATSVTGTGQTGTLDATGTSNTTLTGVSGTGQIGDEATSSGANVYVTGEQATGFTGTVNTTGTANVSLTGVVGTGQTGTVSFYAEANVNVTGVSGTGAIGQVAIAVQDIITGGAFAFGAIAASTIADARADYDQIQTQGVEVYLTGVTGTGQTGTVAVTADNNIAVTGVFAIGVVPQRDTTNGGAFALGPIATAPIADAYEPIPEVICTSSTAVTGVVGTGETGTLTMSGDSNVYPIGVSGAGQIGDEATSADANVYVSGVQATGQTGTVVVIGAANVYPLGVVGTTVLGTVDTTSDANVYPTGVVGSGQVGTIAMTGAANVYLTGVQAVGQIGYVIIESGYVVTGVQATAYVGTVSVWSDINDSQNPDWQAINDSQIGSWSDINDTQASSWQPVDDSQTNDWEEVDDGNTVVWKQVAT